MAEKLRITTKKQICEFTCEHIDIIEIYKDMMDGDSLITSFLTEVSCLKFRHCNQNDCLLKRDRPAVKWVKPNPKQKPVNSI